MIPFQDNVRSRTYPLVTIGLILANLAAFLYELGIPEGQLAGFFEVNGLVPARIKQIGAEPMQTVLAATRGTLLSMFLHGGWLHLIGNMWYLWIFGDNIEDRVGHLRFLVFYLLCGTIASLTHVTVHVDSQMPTIGASGAVAGVLGAYLITYPFARILTVVPMVFIWPVIRLPAIVVLGSWFVLQIISGTAGLDARAETVAWWSHIGGFVAGLLLIGVFTRPETGRFRWGRVT
jgi:membrane associated rhomboid family serine protease